MKCPECKALNDKSNATCTSCKHDLKQGGRSHVSEAGLHGRQRKDRIGRFADVPGVGDDAPKTNRDPFKPVYPKAAFKTAWNIKPGDPVEGHFIGGIPFTGTLTASRGNTMIRGQLEANVKLDAPITTKSGQVLTSVAVDVHGDSGVGDYSQSLRRRQGAVAEAVAAVLEADGKDGKGKSGRRAGRTRRGKFGDLPTLATGKRAAPKGEASTPTAKGSAEAAGPTSVAEADAWGGKPGTNWKQVTPDAKNKLSGILKHYKGMAHPFTTCVADNTKRFGAEGAKKVCAVVKDLNEHTTKWRKGGKTQEAALELPEERPGYWEVRLCEAAGVDDDAGVALVCEAVMAYLEPLDRAVLESLA